MKRIYFGTDGIRGPFGGPVINEDFATRLGEAVGQWIGGSGTVLIGRDTRASGVALSNAIGVGLSMAGLNPISLGVVPTPAVARAVRDGDAVLGVVVTASHNPAGDNGIKFFLSDGTKLSDEQEVAIEGLVAESTAAKIVQYCDHDGAKAAYIETMGQHLPVGSLQGWKIVLDTANGAAAETSPAVLSALGAEVILIGGTPDGININAGVGSEHPEQMATAVAAHGARLGIAHDGDGDRCIFCDEKGIVLDGDEVLTLLAVDGISHDDLPENTLVITVQSNLGVDAAVQAAGGRVLRTDVGDRYVSESMRRHGAGLGGESSGHLICHKIGPSGDGLGAALLVLQVMQRTGLPLSELRQKLVKFPQRSGAVKVAFKKPLPDCPTLSAVIRALELELADRGRVLVRFSGTESKLRLLIEGPDEVTVETGYARLAAAAAVDLELLPNHHG
jgi:phosphoglucosamine mutase